MSCCGTDSAQQGSVNGSVLDDVKEYYGKTLQATSDLQTGACQMGGPQMPAYVRSAIKNVHKDVKDRYYGCGLVIPDSLEGANVLDLGSGSGLDCYVLSALVGERGHVTGLDMTDEQLEVARKHIPYHTEKYGYNSSNVDFVQGYIEKLGDAGIKPNFYDIIVSNCVVNLSPDKRAVLTEAYNSLKEGGELYFSDVYADTRVPEDVRKHKVLWGECIAGALWWEDLHTIAAEVGFSAPRLVTANSFDISKPELLEVLGDIKFLSATYRLFKLPKEAQSACGVVYEGSINHCEDQFVLDHRNKFENGNPVTVNSDIATILKASRFADDFTFQSLASVPQIVEKVRQDDPFDFARGSTKTASSGGCCGPDSSKQCC